MIRKDDVQQFISDHDFEVLVVLGAGDLDNQVPEIEQLLRKKYGIKE